MGDSACDGSGVTVGVVFGHSQCTCAEGDGAETNAEMAAVRAEGESVSSVTVLWAQQGWVSQVDAVVTLPELNAGSTHGAWRVCPKRFQLCDTTKAVLAWRRRGAGGGGALDDALDDGNRVNKEVAQGEVVEAVREHGDRRGPELKGLRPRVGAAQRRPRAIHAAVCSCRRAAQRRAQRCERERDHSRHRGTVAASANRPAHPACMSTVLQVAMYARGRAGCTACTGCTGCTARETARR